MSVVILRAAVVVVGPKDLAAIGSFPFASLRVRMTCAQDGVSQVCKPAC